MPFPNTMSQPVAEDRLVFSDRRHRVPGCNADELAEKRSESSYAVCRNLSSDCGCDISMNKDHAGFNNVIAITRPIELNDGPLTDFELYYTKNGLVQVSNDVRRRILHELSEQDLSLTDLSRITGKAQSTLSVHLDKMVSECLISSHDDPADSRRKIYSLVSVMLAHSKPPSDEAMTLAMNVLTKVADDPLKLRDALARFLFLGFDAMGLSVEPMASVLGSIHAMALGGSLTGATFEETVAAARDYYKKMDFGDVSVFSLKPLTIIIKDRMSYTEASATALGFYAAGFFSKVMEDATGRPYQLTSSEVFGSDCNYFRFVIEPSTKNA